MSCQAVRDLLRLATVLPEKLSLSVRLSLQLPIQAVALLAPVDVMR